jgi:chromatin remodeling complex protein RSC6
MAKKSVKIADTPAETVTPTTTEDVATEVDAKQTVDAVVSTRFEELNQKVLELSNALRELQTSLKTAQKDLVKLVKANVKKSKTRTNTGAKKTPSGFAVPTKLSDQLCDFLGVPHGTEKARTEVTRLINTYIKENNLQDPSDKRIIHPNEKLATILNNEDGKQISFFNMQQKLKHNFIKTTA